MTSSRSRATTNTKRSVLLLPEDEPADQRSTLNDRRRADFLFAVNRGPAVRNPASLRYDGGWHQNSNQCWRQHPPPFSRVRVLDRLVRHAIKAHKDQLEVDNDWKLRGHLYASESIPLSLRRDMELTLGLPEGDNSDANEITFAVSGTDTAWVEGTGNGDPSCLVNNKSPVRPAYHGLALGVIGSGNATGTITVTATSPGLTSSTVEISVQAQDPTADDFSTKWCHQEPRW